MRDEHYTFCLNLMGSTYISKCETLTINTTAYRVTQMLYQTPNSTGFLADPQSTERVI